MVKFGKKFFFNNTYLKKNKIFTIIISCSLIVLIVTTFFVTNYFYDKKADSPKTKITMYDEIDTEIFNSLPNILNYFKILENVSDTDIKIEYPENFVYEENLDNCSEEQKSLINKIRNENYQVENSEEAFNCIRYLTTQLGNYKIKFTINKKEYSSTLNVIDITAPILKVKEVIIKEGDYYQAEDFLDSCSDNSKEQCYIDFYNPKKGVKVNYSNYKDPGEYEIKIIAEDQSGNVSEAMTTKLTIQKIIYYTVSFDSNGGSSISSQTIKENTTALEPLDPSKSNYSFAGWYLNNSKFDFNTAITSDITLIANWTKNSSGGGGSGGGGSGGGGSSGGGSGGDNTCKYGTYDDYVGDISMYATIVNQKSLTDCMEKNTGDTNSTFQTLVNYSDNITTKGGKLRTELDEYVKEYYCNNSYCNIKYNINSQGVQYNGGLVGIYITIQIYVNNSTVDTISLENCTKSYCSWY